MSEIDALLTEDRRFPASAAFRAAANISDAGVYVRAAQDPEAFWAGFARELEWVRPWDSVLKWNPPHARWFDGGTLNASVNCLDRHVRSARRNKAAIIWEGEPGDRRTLTYWDLFRQVGAFANVLKSLGVKRGDRVAIYLPLIPELAIAMLACARIGAVHNVVFGGFSAESLRDRINDCQAVLLVTADGGYRRGQVVPLKRTADEALRDAPSVNNVVVVQRQPGAPIPVDITEGRDHWYHRLMQHAGANCEPEAMNAEDMLYVLYTSGTTGKPKGIVHTTGGYLVGCYATTKWVFDLKDDDVYWCTADIGWVTGHSYVVYGPLANGATVVMYEGAPDWPEKNRFWDLIERHGVTIFYTAPTAIRAFMKWGTEWPAGKDLSTLRLLGSVGEPINPEAWIWYHKNIGRERCPIVDTWWQTETGMIMITPLPGITTTVPGSATQPFPGIAAEVRDAQGNRVETGGGLLVLTKPWPAMLRGIYGDPERYVKQVLVALAGRLFHRGRRASRSRRLLLADGTRGRRAERGRAPARHDGSRERARRSPQGGRGRGRRAPPRDKRTSHRGLRHREGGCEALGRARRRVEGARCPEDRRDCPAGSDSVRGRPAEDAVRENHAPAAPGHRGREGARRHHDARGSHRGREAQRRVRRKRRLIRRGSGTV